MDGAEVLAAAALNQANTITSIAAQTMNAQDQMLMGNATSQMELDKSMTKLQEDAVHPPQ